MRLALPRKPRPIDLADGSLESKIVKRQVTLDNFTLET